MLSIAINLVIIVMIFTFTTIMITQVLEVFVLLLTVI